MNTKSRTFFLLLGFSCLNATTRAEEGTLPAATPKREPVVFMAYNLRNYLTMKRCEAEVTPKPESEINALVEQIVKVNPDILGVCEIGTPVDLKDLQSRLIAKGLSLTESEYAGGGDATRHLALLSRHPISATHSQRELYYKLENTSMPFQRGILDATVWISPDYQIRFLGVHLKSKREIDEASQEQMRHAEAQLLRDYADKVLTENSEENLLVYGDFNDDRNTPTIRIVKGNFGSKLWLEPVLLKDNRGEVWTHYWSTADSYSRLDYVMASKAIRREIISDGSYIPSSENFYDASDHRPLVIKVDPHNVAE